MSKFSDSLWLYLNRRGILSTEQFESAIGSLTHLLPPIADEDYNEFRTARNILRLWHSAGWLEYDYEVQKVIPKTPTLVSYIDGSQQYVNLVAADRNYANAFKNKFGGDFTTTNLYHGGVSDLYPPIYQMPLKQGMLPDIKSDDLLSKTPGINDVLSRNTGLGAEYYDNIEIINGVPRLEYMFGRKKFYYDTNDLCFKEGEPNRPGNFFTRYLSTYDHRTDCIWRQSSSLVPVNRQFRIIKEWAWGVHIALAEAYGIPSTVMYDPVNRIMACYMITPLPRAISRLLAWHGGRPPGFKPRWFDPLRGRQYPLYLYHNVSHAMALSVATKLGFSPDKKPLRLILV